MDLHYIVYVHVNVLTISINKKAIDIEKEK